MSKEPFAHFPTVKQWAKLRRKLRGTTDENEMGSYRIRWNSYFRHEGPEQRTDAKPKCPGVD